jgi:hypothetical protein
LLHPDFDQFFASILHGFFSLTGLYPAWRLLRTVILMSESVFAITATDIG